MAKAKKNKKIDEKQRVLTPEFRVSFPHMFKPSAMEGSEKLKYSVVMLFDKKADLSTIKAAIRAAKVNQFGPNKEDWPDDLESPVIDGDIPKHAKKEGYAGNYAIKASTGEDQKPGLVDKNVEPIVDQADFYPGCYARAYVFARYWEFGDKHGIHFILDHVQKTKDGKAFSSKKPVDQVFSPIAGADDEESFNEESDDDEGFM